MNEILELDVLIVGGGSAGLSAAYELARLAKNQVADPQGAGSGFELNIGVLEKGGEIGAHSFSGAVLNPIALRELFPDWKERCCPIESEVISDSVYYLTESSQWKLPITPPPFKNHGNLIVSLSKFNRWLAQECEALGVSIFPGFAAVEVIEESGKVVGVRTGEKGLNKVGEKKQNYEPGLEIRAKVVIFAEGTRGSLFKKFSKKNGLRSACNEEVFEEGVKEIIQLPAGRIQPGQVIHTMGYPLSKSIGGTFIYTLPNDRLILGMVCYLDSHDPLLDPHRELQKLKKHPWIAELIQGGQVIAYGGKTLPAGGWYSIPQLFGDGWMVVGDSASLVDVQKLKGIHLAMKSGIEAARAAFEAFKSNDFSAAKLALYKESVDRSYIKKELFRVRNFHQTLSQGLISSLPLLAIQEITGGRGLVDRMSSPKDASTTERVAEVWGTDTEIANALELPQPDGKIFHDKLTSVYLTGTQHDEDSPNHLKLQNGDICRTECEPKYKSPCTHFCPAAVYEMIPSGSHLGAKELQINFTNCIHCKTCDIKCPFENIDWTPPEGGGGPQYRET